MSAKAESASLDRKNIEDFKQSVNWRHNCAKTTEEPAIERGQTINPHIL